jgi:hypothetical protein
MRTCRLWPAAALVAEGDFLRNPQDPRDVIVFKSPV